MNKTKDGQNHALNRSIITRRATAGDLDHITALDQCVTGTSKPGYWRDIYERYATRRVAERFFLIAESKGVTPEFDILGYIVGEIRGWEFGSEPCGWVFAFSVHPDIRLHGVGETLFESISDAFRAAGVSTMRTMVPRQNQLHMAFFRSEGMVAGPYIQLEKSLND